MSQATVLIIDDTPDTVRLLSGLLKDQYKVRVATSGPRGCELARTSEPDVILLDVVMPDVDGYETCRRLKAQPETCDVPIIFLTARADESDERLGLELGAADYITKPINRAILLARVDTQVRLKRATDLLRDENRSLESAVAERTAILQATNEALTQFVPREFLAALGRTNITDVEIGDHVHREMTVLFCDIRSYTSMAERMSPREAFEFVNEHLGGVGPVIRDHSGFVAQFYGDGVMAIFPGERSDAIDAAIAIQRRVDEQNRARVAAGREPICVGVGLNSGPLTIGVIGDDMRADTGVVGDTVNSAARMEQLTKTYGVRILASEPVLRDLDGRYQVRFLDRVQVRGKQHPVPIYDVFEADPEPQRRHKQATKAVLSAGQDHFGNERYADAVMCFGEVLRLLPQDRATLIHLERAARCLLEPRTARIEGEG